MMCIMIHSYEYEISLVSCFSVYLKIVTLRVKNSCEQYNNTYMHTNMEDGF